MGIFDKLRTKASLQDDTTTPFQYYPLPESGIRLVTFTKKGIDIRTHVTRKPDFVALSYVCGESPKPPRHHLLCRDVDHKTQGLLAIPPNLFEAISHLRSLDFKDYPIWIDAICIDQNVDEEKERLVPRMDDIYKTAHMTLIWLGPHSQNSKLGMIFMKAASDPRSGHVVLPDTEPILAAQIESTRRVLADGIPVNPSREGFIDLGLPRYGHPVWEGLIDLLTRPWTTRIWTFQEAMLAQSALVICGSTFMQWSHFLHMGSALIRTHIIYQQVSRIPSNLLVYETPAEESGKFFLLYLISCRPRLCLLKEDRVYALLSLASKTIRSEIQVKYSKDDVNHYQNVYLSAARALIQSGLLYGLLKASSSYNKSPAMASWCPDWSLPTKSVPVAAKSEAGFPLKSMQLHMVHPQRSHSLIVRGACIDKIHRVIDDYEWQFPDQWDDRIGTAADMLLQWLRTCYSLTKTTVTDRPFKSSYWETMLGYVKDRMSEDYSIVQHGEEGIYAFAKWLAELKSGVTEQDDTSLSEQEMVQQMQVQAWMARQWPGRVFFTTQGGRVGYADKGVVEGDMVCVFFGEPDLYVLRRKIAPRYAGGEEMEFQSPAFVHGLMMGEGCKLVGRDEVTEFEMT